VTNPSAGVGSSEIETVPIKQLRVADSPRLNGESIAHVKALAASEVAPPPILVHRATMRVIDGMHRLRAALLRGSDEVEVRFFEGTEDEVFIVAVRENTVHGLPLTLADRKAAAARIIETHSEKSDRWVASVCGLSAGTVAVIRRRASAVSWQTGTRVGRDGKIRPVNTSEGRRIAARAISERPYSSLREIARISGISPATVRDVRNRLKRGDDPIPDDQRAHVIADARFSHIPWSPPMKADDPGPLLHSLRKDPSLRLSETGRTFLRALHHATDSVPVLQELADVIPAHSTYNVSRVARHYADLWLRIALQLEDKLQSMPPRAKDGRASSTCLTVQYGRLNT
jgi:hypothetical protein